MTGVSILARPEGRALPGLKVLVVKPILVSILARPEGRALLQSLSGQLAARVVSILARPEGRALPESHSRPNPSLRFQSSPAPKDGRYLALIMCSKRIGRFQSSPAPKDGRYSGLTPDPSLWIDVSILARPEGRALQYIYNFLIPKENSAKGREPRFQVRIGVRDILEV